MGLLTYVGSNGQAFSGMRNRVQNLILNTPRVIHLTQSAVNDEKPNETTMASFVSDFEAVVQTEVRKSLDCIELIKEDIHHCRTESQQLRKELHLEAAANKRARLIDKIAANKEWIAECEERIFLINQRAAVLQEQLGVLSLQSQAAKEIL